MSGLDYTASLNKFQAIVVLTESHHGVGLPTHHQPACLLMINVFELRTVQRRSVHITGHFGNEIINAVEYEMCHILYRLRPIVVHQNGSRSLRCRYCEQSRRTLQCMEKRIIHIYCNLNVGNPGFFPQIPEFRVFTTRDFLL